MICDNRWWSKPRLGDEEGISFSWHVVAGLDFMAETYGIKASSFGQKCWGLQIQALLG